MKENLIHTLVVKRNSLLSHINVRTFYMRKAFCKLRLSAHNLLIETGRCVKLKDASLRKNV